VPQKITENQATLPPPAAIPVRSTHPRQGNFSVSQETAGSTVSAGATVPRTTTSGSRTDVADTGTQHRSAQPAAPSPRAQTPDELESENPIQSSPVPEERQPALRAPSTEPTTPSGISGVDQSRGSSAPPLSWENSVPATAAVAVAATAEIPVATTRELSFALPATAETPVETSRELSVAVAATGNLSTTAVSSVSARPQRDAVEGSGSLPPANPLAQVSPPPAQASANHAAAHPSTEAKLEPSIRPAVESAGGVHTARLVQGATQTEMHIGLRTQAFGSVEVHTALRDAQVGLAVSSEKGDLRAFLQPDLPALHTLLHRHDLRFENIRFLQSEAGLAAGFSSPRDSRQQAFTPGSRLPALHLARVSENEEPGEMVGETTRLSVHA